MNIHRDHRGELLEVAPQVLVSYTRPDVTRGNHYHKAHTEKFLVIRGEAIIRLRRVGSTNTRAYHVHGDEPRVIDIPENHIHNITNVGKSDMTLLVWSSQVFDPENPDTFGEKVCEL
jgi:UDP-2-acetamido-2,6-beta-L-arabino-hexul-4-ose reductase